MDNQEKEPETFQELTPARLRAWSSLRETQLFLRMLEEARDNARDNVFAACLPNAAGHQGDEARVAFNTERVSLQRCIDVILGAAS